MADPPYTGIIAWNSAEGGSDGTTVTAGNSGGDSGHAWDAVNGGATVKYEADDSIEGALSYLLSPSGASSNLVWTSATLGTLTATSAGVFYIRMTAMAGSTMTLVLAQQSNGGAIAYKIAVTAAGYIRLIRAANTTVATSSTGTAVSTGTWYRVEWQIDHATSGYAVQVYLGDETTPLQTLSGTDAGGGFGGGLAQITFGRSQSPDYTAQWDALAISDAAIGPRRVTVPVEASRSTLWAARASVTADRATTWHTRAVVARSRSTLWATRAAVAASRSTTWHTRATTGASRSTMWHLRAAVDRSRSTTWHTRAQATATRSTGWAARTSVIAARSTTWTTRALVGQTRSTLWHVAGTLTTVAASVSSTWHTRAQVAAQRSTGWQTRTLVGATRATTWTVRALVARPASTAWGVRRVVDQTRATIWQVRATLTRAHGTAWGVRSLVGAARATRWHVQTLAPVTTAWSQWDGTGETPLTLAGQWDGTTIQPLAAWAGEVVVP